MAEKFFGKDNLKKPDDIEEIPALSPLTLYCKDRHNSEKVTGFSAKFCKSQQSQTDVVGICVGKDYDFVTMDGSIKVKTTT